MTTSPTGATGSERHHELSDDRLDDLLAAADAKLLTYLTGQHDPSTLWRVLLAQKSAASHPSGPAALAFEPDVVRTLKDRIRTCRLAFVLDRARTLARHIIDTYAYARTLARALDRARDFDLVLTLDIDLDHALSRAHALVRDLNLDLGLVRDLDLDRISYLDLGLVRDLDLDRISYLDLNLDLVVVLVHTLDRACDRGFDHVRVLTEGELSVEGIDLSSLEIDPENKSALIGVYWDDATIWPPTVASLIRRVSVEITPGVYQVRTCSPVRHRAD